LRHPGLAERLVLADCGAAFSEPGRAAFRGMSARAGEVGLAGIADGAMRRLFSPAFQAENAALIASGGNASMRSIRPPLTGPARRWPASICAPPCPA